MKLYLAGAQSKHHFKTIAEVGYGNVLMSYLYLRQQRKDLEYYVDLAGYEMKFMIDSGAHTFIAKPVEEVLAKECKKYSPQDAVKLFIDDYLAWIEKNRRYINLVVEMDIAQSVWLIKDAEEHKIEKTSFFKKSRKEQKMGGLDAKIYVGEDLVWDWRANIFSQLDVPCCMVLHGEEVEEVMNYTSYIGTNYKAESGSMGKIFSLAKKHSLNVHGFAMTGEIIRKYPFTSADSTSWLMGVRNGLTYYLQGGKMRGLDPENKIRRKKWKKLCKEIGVDFEAFIADEGDAVNKFNCYQWKLYGDYMEKRWQTNRVGIALEEQIMSKEEKLQQTKDVVQKKNDVANTHSVPLNKEWDKPFSFLKCVDCYLQKTCPKFNLEESCYYEVSIDLERDDSLKDMLNQVISLQYGRVMRGKMVEESDGGVPDKILSAEIQLLMQVLKDTKHLTEKQQDEVLLKAKGKGAITQMLESMKDKFSKE